MVKTLFSNFLRKIRLIYFADLIRFYIVKNKQRKKNILFSKQNPNFLLPPSYLIYESFNLDYENYYRSGKHDAEEIIKIVSRHETLDTTKILDWGCGPGRIIRHFPALLPTSEFYGTDYNKKTIDWCSANLPNINFNKNLLSPELPYQNDYFDLIYGISIFTHLSLEMHYGWFEELYRITKPGGILYITSQGDNFRHKLSVSELQDYENDTLVIRDNVKEGHRTFTTFHPPKFMRNLFERMEILEHIITKPPQGENWIPQDKWVLRKRIKNS